MSTNGECQFQVCAIAYEFIVLIDKGDEHFFEWNAKNETQCYKYSWVAKFILRYGNRNKILIIVKSYYNCNAMWKHIKQ